MSAILGGGRGSRKFTVEFKAQKLYMCSERKRKERRDGGNATIDLAIASPARPFCSWLCGDKIRR
jgi:hypothetical protein